MLEIFKLIGYSKTKLLFHIIDYFPKHCKGPITDQIVNTNPDTHQRITGITAKDYYAYMKEYEELGFLTRVSGLKYYIDFNKIKGTTEYEYRGDTL
jgi:hypothetical protein